MGQYVNAILKDDDSLWIWDNVGIGPKSNGNMVKIESTDVLTLGIGTNIDN